MAKNKHKWNKHGFCENCGVHKMTYTTNGVGKSQTYYYFGEKKGTTSVPTCNPNRKEHGKEKVINLVINTEN